MPSVINPPARRWRWFRFSLRTLVLFTLAIAGGVGLYLRWAPWVKAWALTAPSDKGWVRVLGFSPDSRWVACLREPPSESMCDAEPRFTTDDTSLVLAIHDATTGKTVHVLRRHMEKVPRVEVYPFRWSSDCRWLLFPIEIVDGQWLLGDLRTGKLHDVVNPGWFGEFSPDSRFLMLSGRHATLVHSLTDRGLVEFYQATVKTMERTPSEANDYMLGMASVWSPDGSSFAAVNRDEVRIWDVAANRKHADLAAPEGYLGCLARYLDSERLAVTFLPSGARTGPVLTRIFRVDEATQQEEFNDFVVEPAQNAPPGRIVVRNISGKDRYYIRSVADSTQRVDLDVLERSGYGEISLSPDGRILVWNDKPSLTVSTDDGRALFVFPGEIMALSSDTERAIVNEQDAVRIRRPADGKELWVWHELSKPRTVFFSPDGASIAFDGGKDAAELWQRRRPEQWWGMAWLPEFWLTLSFAIAFCWSAWRDRQARQEKSIAGDTHIYI